MEFLKKQRKNGNFYLVFALMIMAILFYSSSQTYGQQSQLSRIDAWFPNQPFKEALSGIQFTYGESVISIDHSGYSKFIEFFLRKGAHFGTYFLLGGSLYLGVFPKMKIWWLTGVLAWLSATGYAGLDEFHQMLTGDRSPMFEDVMLDSMGALTAVVICILFTFIKKRK
ncbi:MULTISPECIES: VanZ family protein [Enterococcus]|uniref:VanZ family protein n=1 Tax=Enterococcus mundtii TaxID=53346 RepID=A0A2T5DGS1_ENTMU|nr:VanZ family protein [Enterococcus mundtii]MBE6171705.1 VanZ family protein [Enterococcus faecium]MBO1086296.1 VanZ family protein [Enterococcus mundtii]MDV7744281.1 VanZ family protein [Enterococcus mundtii]PTO37532.1 VanZ family protein [Enterococcus mundtii]